MREQGKMQGGKRKKKNIADMLVHIHVAFGWVTLFRHRPE